jgi:hypothetical protein
MVKYDQVFLKTWSRANNSKTKHITIKYHFLWEHVAKNNIRVEYVSTKEQVVDIFTKPLPREAFEYLRQRLGVISTPK